MKGDGWVLMLLDEMSMSVVRDINMCERRKVHGSGMRVVRRRHQMGHEQEEGQWEWDEGQTHV